LSAPRLDAIATRDVAKKGSLHLDAIHMGGEGDETKTAVGRLGTRYDL
jgi:hypothetical protein